MTKFGKYLSDRRVTRGLKVQDIAREAGLDASQISRYEQGSRIPARQHLAALATAYGLDQSRLRTEWLAAKVIALVEEYPMALEVLQVAESRIAYLRGPDPTGSDDQDPSIRERLHTVNLLRQRWREVHPFDPVQLKRMSDWLRTQYTFESNRIEGNTLTLQETEMVIHQGLTIGGKTMQEHLEAINHASAIDLLLDLVRNQEDFGPRILRELHSLILRGIAPEHAGRYRQVPVRISGSSHLPPQPWELDRLMEDYFAFYFTRKEELHPVILAAEMHERLVTIHPFIDGNGRTSRLVMNLILLRNGYTIVNLKGDPASRLAYYRALEAVQSDNRPEVFHGLILDHAIVSLEEHLSWTAS